MRRAHITLFMLTTFLASLAYWWNADWWAYVGLRPTRVPTSRRRCLLFPSKGIGKRRVPETSPCHGQAKQSGELDPRKVTMDCRERSRGIETSTELVSRQSQRIGSVRE